MPDWLGALRERLRHARLRGREPAEVFAGYHARGKWREPESASGKGSTLAATAGLRAALPGLLGDLGVTRLLDVPCGDFNWMARVDLAGIDYHGGDIVPALIAANADRHGGAGRRFSVIDLITGPLPETDLVFTRDCLVHLSHAHALRALATIRASGARWLMATTYPGRGANPDIVTGQWRALDLTAPPYGLPAPERMVAESYTGPGGAADKCMGLWRVADLPGDA